MTADKEDSLLSKYEEIMASLEDEIKINTDHFTVKRLIYEAICASFLMFGSFKESNKPREN